ncbi:hypothetical protein E2542_SST14441 [Spatholobus suberectus]|nr:hypothetical protein E2542_SST14441 [Spatholobus suberectus]
MTASAQSTLCMCKEELNTLGVDQEDVALLLEFIPVHYEKRRLLSNTLTSLGKRPAHMLVAELLELLQNHIYTCAYWTRW